ncbi:hypothetical protein DENSPDRAFT_773523, partial [Dentipellis sp. KUC8613]
MLRHSPDIHGFQIPGLDRQVLISLFADDTALYLNENTNYHSVQQILDRWCRASGAKFNINKTEIIPIGTPAYRNRLTTQRTLNPTDALPLDPQIRISPDGHPIRYLGAWIGNDVDDAVPWEPILDKMRTKLTNWLPSRPTLMGKRLIVQMVVAGSTQFLTQVNGMPKHIESAILTDIKHFLWPNRRSAAISLDTLYLPVKDGGIGLLDLQACNEATDIIWLKSYLDLSPSRPAWAFIADILINRLAPSSLHDIPRINAFLQNWSPVLQGPRTNAIPHTLLTMLKVAKKYNTNFAVLRLTDNLKRQIPAWCH